jgi:hypothetical protein
MMMLKLSTETTFPARSLAWMIELGRKFYYPYMPFSKDDPAFARRCGFAARGRARAAFWRKQSWPNMQRAWQGQRRYCERLRAEWTEEQKRKHDATAERARRWRESKQRRALENPSLLAFFGRKPRQSILSRISSS